MQEALRFLSPGAEPVDRADFVEQARRLRRGPETSARALSLTIRGLRKSFGDNEVLRGIDLHIPAGQSVAIVGRSGCGKSTLLRLIAGLETATAGTIDLGEDARPEDVRVMFQEPRLLPWARVLGNVEVGLGRERRSPQAQGRAAIALAEVELGDKRDQWPAVLSGGQKGSHRIEGIGIGFIPPHWRREEVDEVESATSEEAMSMCRRLAREEGIFAGTSSGLNVIAALRVARKLGPDATVATIMIDSGLRYMSTDLYR